LCLVLFSIIQQVFYTPLKLESGVGNEKGGFFFDISPASPFLSFDLAPEETRDSKV